MSEEQLKELAGQCVQLMIKGCLVPVRDPSLYASIIEKMFKHACATLWIKTSERLPEDKSAVVVNDGHASDWSYFTGGEFWGGGVILKPLYWFPIPELPKPLSE